MTEGPSPFDTVDLDAKRRGRQVKWTRDGPDVVGAWVAEHDFDRPAEVTAALASLVTEGAWGYDDRAPELAPAFAGWAGARYGWDLDPAAARLLVDTLQGVWAGVELSSQPGDGVIVTPPVYFPFLRIADTTGRRQLDWRMRRVDGRWDLDLDDLRDLARREPSARVIVLCHPHNPTGRVMSREWLAELVAVAAEHDLFIVSDEIHADLVHPGRRFTPLLTVPGAAERAVAVTSAGKTFAASGFRCAVLVAPDPAVATRFDARFGGRLLGWPGRAGIDGTLAAWTHGHAWADELVRYLTANRDHLVARLAAEAPAVALRSPEATFLAWLDVSACGLGNEPAAALLDRARVALSEGATFGPGGEGHVRLNFGTSRSVLDDIIDRLVPHLAG